jgi:hypothetical protein
MDTFSTRPTAIPALQTVKNVVTTSLVLPVHKVSVLLKASAFDVPLHAFFVPGTLIVRFVLLAII